MRAAIISPIVKFISCAVVLLILSGVVPLFSGQTFAAAARCDEPVFGVQGVRVDQSAETASMARDIGSKLAAKNAFVEMLSRLLGDQDKISDFIASNDLDEFMDFVHIVEEKNLDRRYIATLDFCFDAPRLRQAMISAGLSWAELRSPNILIIPVWRGPDGVRAWDKGNKWITGWWDAVKAWDGLLALRVLERNLINERRFRGEDLAESSAETIAQAASLANAEQVLIVQAALDFNHASPEVSVTTSLYGKKGGFIALIDHFDPIPLENSRAVELVDIRAKIIGRMIRSWHSANLIDGSALYETLVYVPVSSLQEWAMRLKALDQVAVILSYDILSLDTRGGLVRLRLAGSLQALKNALAAHRLRLLDENGRMSITAKMGSG